MAGEAEATPSPTANAYNRAQPEGGFGGGQIGYNFQSGSFVYGVETDFQGGDISDRVTGSGSPAANAWIGSARCAAAPASHSTGR